MWWQSRRDALLIVFAAHCVFLSLLSAVLVVLVNVHTVSGARWALAGRIAFAALGQITSVWLLSLISSLRARWFVWTITGVFLATALAAAAGVPLAGTVTAVDRVMSPWGEEFAILRRESPSRVVPALYAFALAINVYGFVCAARLAKRDRTGGALLFAANALGVVVTVWALQIDESGRPVPYIGGIHHSFAVVLLATQIARDYRLRGAESRQARQLLEESREQLQRLTAALMVAREEERTRISREIHDVLGQSLTALKMDAAWIGRRLQPDSAALEGKLSEMMKFIDETVVTVRRMATELRPGILDDLGLAAAAQWQVREFERRTGMRCTIRTWTEEQPIDPFVATSVFRILQESLTNVARHSDASAVDVMLERDADGLVLEVRDNGIGITAVEAADVHSIGIAGMRERAQLVSGDFSISGSKGKGCTIRVRVPLQQPAHA